MTATHAKVAIVTGSTSGIGAAIAVQLASDGFTVVVTGRDQARGNAVTARMGARGLFVRSDLTEAGAASRLVEEAIKRAGRLDVVVNNAAIDHTDRLIEADPDDVRRVFESNALTVIAMTQAAARHMMDEGGAIINITSRLASIGVPTMGVYSASKGAVKALTTAAAVELGPHNIRVNAVAPGMTRTPLYDTWLAAQPDPARTEAEVVEGIPLGRMATADDVAAAVSFLASDAAAYITGASLPVDGGYTSR